MYCIDVCTKQEINAFDKIYEHLSTIKSTKFEKNNILIKKTKDMLENLDFEQDYYSRTAIDLKRTWK